MADTPTRASAVQVAQASGETAATQTATQTVVPVSEPPPGQDIVLPAAAGRVYDLQFDPRQAEVRVMDADGDGDLDLVLVFDAGTAEESRIVFTDMVQAAESDGAPQFMVGESQFGAGLVVRQAQALAGEQPTLETAAAERPAAVGTGVSEYNDDFGELDGLLEAQGGLPPQSLSFPSLEPDPEDDLLLEDDTPGLLVVGSDADDQEDQQALHTVANPNESDSGPVLGASTSDALIGDPGGSEFDDLNVAVILDISGSMVDPDNNPAPGVTRLDVVQDALEEILPQLAARGSVVNLFIQTFSTDADEPLFVGELTPANVDEIVADIMALDGEAAGATNYEAPLAATQEWYLDQVAANEGFRNVAFFLTDGDPNRWLDDDGDVAGSGGAFSAVALQQAIAAVTDLLDRDDGTLSGDDQVLLNAIGMGNAREESLDLLDNTETVDPGPPQVGEAQIVNLGDPSAVPDNFLIEDFGVGADEISGREGSDILFGDVPDTDSLAAAQGLGLPAGAGWFAFEALEAGESPVSPGWDRGDTLGYLRNAANRSELIGLGRGEGDSIDAGPGNDVILGQGGDDSLTGGTGADTFVYTLAADEGDDEILDFSTAEGDRLAFVNVSDTDASGTLSLEDVVDDFVDGGGAGAVDSLVLNSGTTVMITDVNGTLSDLASLEDHALVNGAMG